LQDTGYPEEKRGKCLALVAGLRRLAVTAEVTDLAVYVRPRTAHAGE
jgi:hypothetical protein